MRSSLLVLLILAGTAILSRAQDPVPKLIVSEIHMFHTEEAYVEITNMGDQPVDLNRVVFASAQNDQNYRSDTSQNTQFLNNAGILDPGESFVVINYRTQSTDSTNILSPSWYFEKADHMLYYTLRDGNSGMRFGNGDDAFGLFWDLDGDHDFNTSIDTLIDEVGFDNDEVVFDVAGVANFHWLMPV